MTSERPDPDSVDLATCELVYSDRDHDGPYDYHLVEFYRHPSGDFLRLDQSHHIDADSPRITKVWLTPAEASEQQDAAQDEARARERAAPAPVAAAPGDVASCAVFGALAVGALVVVALALAAKLGL